MSKESTHAVLAPAQWIMGCAIVPVMPTVDDLLVQARARYHQIEPIAAAAELDGGGAVLIDIRPRELRERNGDIPGAVVIGLNVLEWRVDPASEWCIPQVIDHDQRIVLMCQEGYSSSLATTRLLDLGLHRSTDISGGQDAWRTADLPVTSFDPEASPERAVQPRG